MCVAGNEAAAFGFVISASHDALAKMFLFVRIFSPIP